MILFVLAVAALPDVPAPLKPWVDWVLYDKKQQLCPFLQGESEKQCAWPARLELVLDKRQGSFSQTWTIDADAWVPLPGDEKHWPLDVKVDGQGALVSDKDGDPEVELKTGVHTVTGRFAWDSLPESLEVPPETGLVGLTVGGKRVRAPERENGGTVYLQKSDDDAGEEQEENRLDVVVHRKVDDDVPLRVFTRVELFVSGKARETVLGPALPKGFVPMALQSPIPARAEANGMLRVQVRPGRWTLMLEARASDKMMEARASDKTAPRPMALEASPADAPWPEEEVWVFQAYPSLRVSEVSEVSALDPQQTTLPDDWKKLPAYRVRKGEHFLLVEKSRGDAETPPDQLSLQRDIWLDFNGNGYTFRDQIGGQKFRAERLEMAAPFHLGRVAVGGSDQFITLLEGARGPGVELGKGYWNVTADSRLEGRAATIPAVGWLQDFNAMSAQLHLPPGWRLLSVSGADDVPGTWFRSWSLLELFLVMITTLGFYRLFGPAAGALAFVALVLSVPEPDAPSWLWLCALAAETLVRLVPAGNRALLWLKLARLSVWVVLAVTLVPFSVEALRTARYPVLEREEAKLGGDAPAYSENRMNAPQGQAMNQALDLEVEEDERPVKKGKAKEGDKKMVPQLQVPEPMKQQAQAPPPMEAPRSKARGDVGALGGKGGEGYARAGKVAVSRGIVQSMSQNLYAHDPKANIQTGPGLPAWRWNQYALTFNGPVKAAQSLTLYLLSPLANEVLGFLRVLSLLLLFAVAIGMPGGFWPRALKRRLTAGMALVALLVVNLLGASVARADDKAPDFLELLDQLEQRLLKPEECAPNCASSGRLVLEAQHNVLRLRLEVSAAARTAVPLPAAEQQWLPERVMLDGKPADGLMRKDDGTLWLRLAPGAHQVIMEGSLPERDTVQIPLPLKPHYVEAHTAGWTLDGLHEDGQADDNLQLSRAEPTREKKREGRGGVEAGVLPPFVRVERQLELGLSWQVHTRILRLTPLGSAVVLDVPLVEGESVTTADVRVENGRAQINMGAQELERKWESVLREGTEIELSAKVADPSKQKTDVSWAEAWSIKASPVWHFAATGLPTIHTAGMEWRPWPGETLTLRVSRPQGTPEGQTLTIDKSALLVTPGPNVRQVVLSMRLRSSRGNTHALRLPKDAELQGLTVGDASLPLRHEDGGDTQIVNIPVAPGGQNVTVSWREDVGVDFATTSPRVDIGAASVNAELELRTPKDRWFLYATGPSPAAPAVLFYPMLLFLIIMSLALARVPGTPLAFHHWLLLGLGLTQAGVLAAFIVVAWFLLLVARKKYIQNILSRPVLFDAWQLMLLCWSVAMLVALFVAVKNGLIVDPDMQVTGNGSHGQLLRWFSDRSGQVLPQATIYSVPLWVFRALMLTWSLWLAQAFLTWLRWAWQCLSAEGLYRPFQWRPWRWFDGGAP